MWQPIETAPKDGSRILIYTSDGMIESFFDGWRWNQSMVYGDWGYETEIGEIPTHWQPLPEAP